MIWPSLYLPLHRPSRDCKAEVAQMDPNQETDKVQVELVKTLDVSAILRVYLINTQSNPTFSVTLNGPMYCWSNFRFGAEGML